jgi:hypothetical protein
MRSGPFISEGHVVHDQHTHDFASQKGQRVEFLELTKCEIVTRSQLLIKGEIWTVRLVFQDFTSRESKRVES